VAKPLGKAGYDNFRDQIGAFLGGLNDKFEGNYNGLSVTGRQKIADKFWPELTEIGNRMISKKPADLRWILENETVGAVEGEELGKFFRFAIEVAKIDNHLKTGVSDISKPLAVIVKGNPKYIDNNPLADTFYADVKQRLEAKGYRVEFDAGEDFTEPDQTAMLVVGHSRGASRLKYANPKATTFELVTENKYGTDADHYKLSSADLKSLSTVKLPPKSVKLHQFSSTVKPAEDFLAKGMYHLSEKPLASLTMSPRVPDNYLTQKGFEDGTTPRVSFAESVDGAIRGLSMKLSGKELHVYVPVGKYSRLTPTIAQVPDSKVTSEQWVTSDVRVKLLGKIKVVSPKDTPAGAYTLSDGTVHELYDANWYPISENALLAKADADPFIRGYFSKRKDTLQVIGDDQGLISVEDVTTASGKWKKVSGVWLDESARGKGLADAAINQVVGNAKSFALIEPDNIASQALFKRLGYRQTGVRGPGLGEPSSTTYQFWERAARDVSLENKLDNYYTALALEQDASSSGAQIIALTTKNKQLAEMSNVVPTMQKRRLYDEIAAATFHDPRFKVLNEKLGLSEKDLRKAAKAQNMVKSCHV
jgi:GNAT superfamily N-acetyltransferase